MQIVHPNILLFFCFIITRVYSLLSLLQRHSKPTITWPASKNFSSWLFLKIQNYTQHVSLPLVLTNILPTTQPLRLVSQHEDTLVQQWRIAAALASISRVSWSALWMQVLYTLCLPEPSSIPGNWHGRCRRTSSRQRLQERDCNKPWMKKSPVCCSPLPAAKSSCVSMAGEAMGSLQMRVYSMCRWSLGLIQLLVGFPAASGAYMEK